MTTFAASQDDHFTFNHQLLSNGASDAFDFNFDSQPASLQQLPHFSFGQLDSAVHSARWMAGGGNSPYNFDAPPPEQQQVSYTPPPTIGEFLQRLPEHRLPASTASVPSAASKYGYGLEDEVCFGTALAATLGALADLIRVSRTRSSSSSPSSPSCVLYWMHLKSESRSVPNARRPHIGPSRECSHRRSVPG